MSYYHRCPTTGQVLVDGMKRNSLLGVERVFMGAVCPMIVLQRGNRMYYYFLTGDGLKWTWDLVDKIRAYVHGTQGVRNYTKAKLFFVNAKAHASETKETVV